MQGPPGCYPSRPVNVRLTTLFPHLGHSRIKRGAGLSLVLLVYRDGLAQEEVLLLGSCPAVAFCSSQTERCSINRIGRNDCIERIDRSGRAVFSEKELLQETESVGTIASNASVRSSSP